MNIGQIIREYRREKGVTLTGLAGRLGISPSYLSAIERSIRKPSGQLLKNISDKLDIPVYFLLETEEDIMTGKRLKSLRENRGLSLEDLSEICDIPVSLLAKYEEGSGCPSPDHLSRLSAGINITIKYFQDRNDGNCLGNRLKKMRMDRNMTVTVLAEKVGVTPGLISQIENGHTNPHLETLERIARALNTSPAYLLMEGRDVEDLLASFNSQMLDVLGDPNTQAVLRSLRDLHINEISFIINYIQFYRHQSDMYKQTKYGKI